MTNPLYVRCAYEWTGHREVPDGQEQVLAEVFFRYQNFPHKDMPPEIKAVYQPGSGYGYTITFISRPPQEQSQEKLATTRRKRLRRRAEAKYPLFAEQVIEEETAKKPEYYDGITRADIKVARDALMSREWERIEEIEKIITEHEKGGEV